MKEERSFYANIWIAGDLSTAKAACREFCEEGLCVTITPTSFIYTGGQQEGVLVRLINYPRFVEEPSAIKTRAQRLGDFLCHRLFQDSYSIEFPDTTEYYERRPKK